jgi:hypothetical protein
MSSWIGVKDGVFTGNKKGSDTSYVSPPKTPQGYRKNEPCLPAVFLSYRINGYNSGKNATAKHVLLAI